MVRGFLGGENHFLQFSFMRSDEDKKDLVMRNFMFYHISRQRNEPIKKFSGETNEPIKKI